MTDADSVRAAVRAGHERLAGLLSDVTDDQARGASELPGWSRAHVLTHLGDLARAFTRQTRAALAGRLVDVYDGGRAGRDASIAAGAQRPAAELVADTTAACAELDAVWAGLDAEQWELPSRYRDATLHAVLLCRWREVEVHTSDLALGVTPRDWSPELCEHLGHFLAPRVPPGTHVTGDPHDLAAWLAGRSSGAGLRCSTGDLPALRPWP